MIAGDNFLPRPINNIFFPKYLLSLAEEGIVEKGLGLTPLLLLETLVYPNMVWH